MKFNALAFMAVAAAPAAAFQPATPLSMPAVASSSGTSLNMVLEKPKKLSKLEILKTQSEHLENPLREVRAFSHQLIDIFIGRCVWCFCFGTDADLQLQGYDKMNADGSKIPEDAHLRHPLGYIRGG